MKKLVFIALVAFALFSCNKEEVIIVENEAQPQQLKYVFNVADKPSFDADTRAVKESWVEGDKIYIVYDDVRPTQQGDFTILEYTSGEWTVKQESSTTLKEEGGKFDALYYENPSPTILYDLNGTFFDRNNIGAGKYMYLYANNIPYTYTAKDGKVEFSLSLDFPVVDERTYVQFRITGLGENERWYFSLKDSQHGNNVFEMLNPVWHGTHHIFADDGLLYNDAHEVWMGERADGYYQYLSVGQKAEAITITLLNSTGESFYKTFPKRISGKCAAITFKGPNDTGNPTNGWTKIEGDINGHAYVDMGSGLKWATTNVTTENLSEYGDFFAWGETSTYYTPAPFTWRSGKQNGYDWTSYFDGEGSNFTTYSNDGGLTVLKAENDAATANWGSGWRIPKEEEWQWLIDNCNWTWTDDYNGTGVEGAIVTSNVEGFTGKSIFLPAAGYYYQTQRYISNPSSGHYWSSSLRTDSSDEARVMFFQKTNTGDLNKVIGIGANRRCTGFPIRAVAD